MPTAEPHDFATADLHHIVDRALARGAGLLTAGELVVAQRIRQLEGPAGGLYARLTNRVGTVWTEASLAAPAAVDELVALGLLSRFVTWSQRADALTVPALKAGCRRCGLPVGGRRDALVERLRGQTGWCDEGFVRLVHPGLVRRLEQWAMLRRRPDRSAFVTERLGVVRWPDYPLSPGEGLFRCRADLLRWEDRLRRIDEVDVDEQLRWLDAGVAPAPGRLSLRRSLVRRVRETARELERQREPAQAATLYARLVAGGHIAVERVAVRHALALEAAGERGEALDVLLAAAAVADPVHQPAIERTGRRLARRLKRGWPPVPPLAAPFERTLTLSAGPAVGSRPGWMSRRGPVVVESAVADLLRAQGRRVLRAEGPLWTTLFALLFADLYFLPLPGALPTRFLAGPLDLGSPSFASRRAEQVAVVRHDILAGLAERRLRRAWERWQGCALAGAHWGLADAGALGAMAAGLGPKALWDVLSHLLARGGRGASGLPDLVVLPGRPARLPAFPSRLEAGLHCVEVKGPGDALRDEQRVWLDRLGRAGVRAEVWDIRPPDAC